MHAHDAAAARTAPPGLFVFDESIKAARTDALQVFEHAHAVFRSVPLIQLLQPPAGKAFALVAKAGMVVFNSFAILDNAPEAGRHFLGIITAAAGTPALFAEVSQADAAIHPAGRNEMYLRRHLYTPLKFQTAVFYTGPKARTINGIRYRSPARFGAIRRGKRLSGYPMKLLPVILGPGSAGPETIPHPPPRRIWYNPATTSTTPYSGFFRILISTGGNLLSYRQQRRENGRRYWPWLSLS